MQWTILTQTGGATIDSYNLQWDAGVTGGPWIDIQGELGNLNTAISSTINVGITPGNTYKF